MRGEGHSSKGKQRPGSTVRAYTGDGTFPLPSGDLPPLSDAAGQTLPAVPRLTPRPPDLCRPLTTSQGGTYHLLSLVYFLCRDLDSPWQRLSLAVHSTCKVLLSRKLHSHRLKSHTLESPVRVCAQLDLARKCFELIQCSYYLIPILALRDLVQLGPNPNSRACDQGWF